MGYRRLAPKDRYQLEAYLERQMGVREISRILEVAPSTISRELKRVKGRYDAESAQGSADRERLKRYSSTKKITPQLKKKIRYRLRKFWSPEQIAADLEVVSHQTIYRFIKKDEPALRVFLRILKKKQKDRTSKTWKRCPVPMGKRQFIDERPKVVERRLRLGDVERDTVLGKVNSTRLLTIVDRRSRLIRLALIKEKSADAIHKETVRLLKREKIHTITNDNSTEFAHHQKTADALNAKVYFSRAYRAWERGTNENLNGLLRQYYPRRNEIGEPTEKELRKVEKSLNSRPRKCLGWKTPLQVHRALSSGQVLR